METTLAIPQHAEVIASHDGEIVVATPAWVSTLETKTHAAAFVDARTWPPAVGVLALRIAAAARLPDGRWLVVELRDGAWCVAWYASITSAQPARVEPVPQAFLDAVTDANDAPIAQLAVCGGVALAVVKGAVHVRRDDAWIREPTFALDAVGTLACAGALVTWSGAAFQREGDRFVALPELRDVRRLVSIGAACFGLVEARLVGVTPAAWTPRLAGQDVISVQRGPHDQLVCQLMTDSADGVAIDSILYDPATEMAVRLPAGVEVAGFTTAGAAISIGKGEDDAPVLVQHELADAVRLAASALPPSQKIAIEAFDAIGAASRPQIATLGDHIMIAVGNVVRVFEQDNPRVIVELQDTIVALVAGGDHVAALGVNGMLWSIDREGAVIGQAAVPARARSLAPIGDRGFAVLAEDGVHVVVDGRVAHVIPIKGAIAAASDGGDGLVIAAENAWLAHWTGSELRDLPPTREQIVAIASLGEGRFACVGAYHLYTLDLQAPELVSLETRARQPFVAAFPATGDIAYCDSPSRVSIHYIANGALADRWQGGVQYSVYIRPDSTSVMLHGVAFTEAGGLVIAIDDGHANLVFPRAEAVRKLDPHPGVTDRQWLFVCGGQILM